MNKSKLAVSVATLIFGMTAGASAQRVTVNDLGFGADSVQVLSAHLQQGSAVQGVYTGPLFSASVLIPSKAAAPEGLLSVYSEGSETPIFTKLLDKDQPPFVDGAEGQFQNAQQGDAKRIGVIPPDPNEEYPQWIQYVTKLNDDSLPEGMLPGKYKARLEFYQVTDGAPEGEGWAPWAYGQEGLVAKLLADSSLPLSIETQEVDIVSYVQSTVNISATAIPGRRAKPADIRKLRAGAKEQALLAAAAARGILADLGRLRIDDAAPWETAETVDPAGRGVRLDHYGTISYDKGEEYDTVVSAADTPLNGSKTLRYPGGVVVVKVSTESSRY